jgi:hypothetical protein
MARNYLNHSPELSSNVHTRGWQLIIVLPIDRNRVLTKIPLTVNVVAGVRTVTNRG